ncbi:cellulase family glycosylhydrolase [Streptomyces sp. RPT161]|uniref:cellulase family glycosylhydrolase n=1 Tax=Streptomyces sp. RPT161 TaxID=3015993 RepID=UPI0022B8E629|nr:cellulase family glycosylhydrolase [Streptomyces sp. RPT161]
MARPLETPAGTVTTHGRTYLADARGRALQLHGLNLGKTEAVTEPAVAQLAASGFDLMRLDIQWSRVEPRRGRYDTAYLHYLDHVLSWADRYHLLVLVDWHQDVYGPRFGGDGLPRWATRTDGLPFHHDPGDWFADYFQPAVQAAFRHLYDDPDLRAAQSAGYRTVALALRGHPSLLGYDLFNEPSGPFPGDPTDPRVQIAASAALERGRLAAMYRRAIAAVRAVDQRAWLFVEPTVLVGEGVPTRLPGFTDPRVGPPRLGYAPHYYDTAVESGADWNPGDGFIAAYQAAITRYPAAHRLPVLVGEWGPPSATTPGNAQLVSRQVASMRRFATGWTMWYDCRAAGGAGYCGYDADGRPAPGKQPAFWPYATAVSGTPDTELYDPAHHTYRLTATLRRTIGRAETQIILPSTAFPNGVRVSVSMRSGILIDQPTRQRPGMVGVLPVHGRPGERVTVNVSDRTD